MVASTLAGCASLTTERIPLRLAEQTVVVEDSREALYSLVFLQPTGDSLVAYLRRPVYVPSGERFSAVVLVAGRETGRRAAEVIPGPLDGVVLAVEYPAVIPDELGAWGLIRRAASIRRTAYRMPGLLTGAASYLAGRPEVDSTRIALVGVSFGVPFAAPAGSDPLFRGVALHHGGADLELLFRTNFPIGSSFVRGLAAKLAAWYLRQLDPARHVADISPRPLLLINGLYDEFVPRRSAERLFELARPPVHQIWLPHDHLMPDESDVMRELADSTLRHFEFLR